MTTTETTTLRSAARQAVIDAVQERLALEHRRNWHKLHIYRDGSVGWTESIDRSADLIDSGADHFTAIPSVCTVGTGSFSCNCQYCNDVYDEQEEADAADEGREYSKSEKYADVEDAIADAGADSDSTEVEADMLAEFDRIPLGYFDGERKLPEFVLASWDAKDWNDRTMTASRYRYATADGSPIELTEKEADLYSWGDCEEDIGGGSQGGRL